VGAAASGSQSSQTESPSQQYSSTHVAPLFYFFPSSLSIHLDPGSGHRAMARGTIDGDRGTAIAINFRIVSSWRSAWFVIAETVRKSPHPHVSDSTWPGAMRPTSQASQAVPSYQRKTYCVPPVPLDSPNEISSYHPSSIRFRNPYGRAC
jgi:hypothetical protein